MRRVLTLLIVAFLCAHFGFALCRMLLDGMQMLSSMLAWTLVGILFLSAYSLLQRVTY